MLCEDFKRICYNPLNTIRNLHIQQILTSKGKSCYLCPWENEADLNVWDLFITIFQKFDTLLKESPTTNLTSNKNSEQGHCIHILKIHVVPIDIYYMGFMDYLDEHWSL